MRPEQCLVVRFDGCVAFADAFLQGFNIGDLYLAPRIIYHSSLLKRSRMQRHAGSLNTQHLGEKFLGEMQIVAARQISRSKKPSAKSRLHMMSGHASGRLACLRVDRLLMTKQQCQQGLTLKHCASEFTHFARQRGPGELHDGLIDWNVAAKSGERADDPVFTDHRGFNYLSRGKTYDKRDNRACREIDVCDMTFGLKQNPLMVQLDGFEVWPKSSGIAL